MFDLVDTTIFTFLRLNVLILSGLLVTCAQQEISTKIYAKIMGKKMFQFYAECFCLSESK